MRERVQCDVAIAGGGLAGSLIALALADKRPDISVAIVESGESIGGNHIWSFFGGDIAEQDRWLLTPLIGHAWPGYHVLFPKRRRKIGAAYYSILSERLDAVVRARLPADHVITGHKIIGVGRTAIVGEGGMRVEAKAVIDARGAGDLSLLDLGWQKFVGQVIRTTEKHGLDRPVVMDATVAQIDGYRFLYILPLGPDRLLIEDTYYSDDKILDRDAIAQRIAEYARARGWSVADIEREEQGVLPVVLGGDFERYWQSGGKDLAKAGVRGGLFHPTTGYSLPDAVRTAVFIADLENPASRALHPALHDHARAVWNARGFYRLLDRMLFRAADPAERYRVMQRFYGLDSKLIARFYAAEATFGDKARILAGRPPIPIGRAISVLREARS